MSTLQIDLRRQEVVSHVWHLSQAARDRNEPNKLLRKRLHKLAMKGAYWNRQRFGERLPS